MVRVVLLWQETAVTVNQARVWHPRPRLDDTIVLSGTISGLMIAPLSCSDSTCTQVTRL